MESIRVTAKTVEDAVTEASITLGTSRDNIEYTVIEKGSSGFFGIGGRKAIIEAKRKVSEEDMLKEVLGEKEEKPKREFREPRRDTRREPRKESFERRESFEERKGPKKEGKKEQPFHESRKEQPKKEFEKEPAKEPVKKEFAKSSAKKEFGKEAAKETAGQPAQTDRSVSSEAGKTSARENAKPYRAAAPKNPTREASFEAARGKGQDAGKEETKASFAEEEREEAVKAPKVPANPEEAIRRAETFLKDLFVTMDMKVEVKSVFEEDTLSIDITGDDMGILIGKRGQTLDSLQYLTSLVVNKGKASYVRVKLDTEDYRNRRKATLENLAKNIAFKVKKTRRPVFLEPMNPYERRIIHSALQNDPYVTTHSEGDEPCRKVVVTLRKDRGPRGQERSYRGEKKEV